LPAGSVLLLFVAILTSESCKLYMAAKDMTPGRLE
jgi:hypothetical protein